MLDMPVGHLEETSNWILTRAAQDIHSMALRQKVKMLAIWISEGLFFLGRGKQGKGPGEGAPRCVPGVSEKLVAGAEAECGRVKGGEV